MWITKKALDEKIENAIREEEQRRWLIEQYERLAIRLDKLEERVRMQEGRERAESAVCADRGR